MGELKPFYIYQQIEDYSLKFIDLIYEETEKKAINKIMPRIKEKQNKSTKFFCIAAEHRKPITLK